MPLEDAEDALVEPGRVPELHGRCGCRPAGCARAWSSRASSRSMVGGSWSRNGPARSPSSRIPRSTISLPALRCGQPLGVGQRTRRLHRHLEPRRQPVVPAGEGRVLGPPVVARVRARRSEADRRRTPASAAGPPPRDRTARPSCRRSTLTCPRGSSPRHPAAVRPQRVVRLEPAAPRRGGGCAPGHAVEGLVRRHPRTPRSARRGSRSDCMSPGAPGAPGPDGWWHSGSTLSAGPRIWGSIPVRPLMWSWPVRATVGG